MSTPATRPPAPGSVQAWAVALRPMSFPLAIGPVAVGAALRYLRGGSVSVPLMLTAMLASLLVQAITNLQNDVGFTQRGGEFIGQRVGLPRATAEGWLSPRAVRIAIVGLSGVALLLGLALVAARGWLVLVLGTASLLAALAYMGGPRPIAYTAWGEVTVVLFFGFVAVLGTDWLVTAPTGAAPGDTSALLAAFATGCLAASPLTVNNHRDAAHDRRVGRQTFVVRFGAPASTALLAVLLTAPFLAQLLLAALWRSPWMLAPLALAPLAWQALRDFRRCAPGLAYNAVLLRLFRLELWFACLWAAAAVLTRVQ